MKPARKRTPTKKYTASFQKRTNVNRSYPSALKLGPSDVIPRNISGFPNFMDVKLVYSESITLTNPAGGGAIERFGANDCYDPYSGVGGHQPLNYDQYSALYQKWVVVKSNIVVRPISTGVPTSQAPVWIGVYLAGTTSIVPTTENNYLEFLRIQPNCSPAALIGTDEGRTDGLKFKRVGANYHALRDNVRSKIEEIPEQFCGGTSTPPSDPWYFHVHQWSAADVTASTQRYTVEITYSVRFWEPKQYISS